MNWYLDVLRKYAVFEGRARRKEYWMFVLFNLIVAFVLAIIEGMIGTGGFIGAVYALAVFVPNLAVAVRRLHDTGRSGWFLLIGLIPLIGIIVLIVFFVQESQPGANKWGPNPKTEPVPASA